ncbi:MULTISPECIES: protein translocase subunit SecF [unclassified Janibacter]|uniref:protein translocase subunit SecF n=1 Tax=unclassified Janibacter TaxID=2649294 RepID=UPI003D07013E
MISFSELGNDLYTGKRSIPFVEKRRTWYVASALLFVLAIVGLGVQKLNLGLEFTGGSEFKVSSVSDLTDYEFRAGDLVSEVQPEAAGARVSKLGTDTIRIQTEELSEGEAEQVQAALAKEFKVSDDKVTASFIGPSWGASVSKQALRALVVFLGLTIIVMALYFRTWAMAVAAMVALAHDMLITVGIYALTGFEVSPATMIGFLTVLGYSLYDTVVVFDKVRENTAEALATKRQTYAEAANLAVNQTLVRSINTTVVALLPIAVVLLVGFSQIGPGTLLDLSLALFIGMAIGAFSSIFIATPLLVSIRSRDERIQAHDAAVLKHRAKRAASADRAAVRSGAVSADATGTARPEPVDGGAEAPEAGADSEPVTGERLVAADGDAATLTGRKVHKYAQTGPRNQPRRPPKSKR